MVFVRGNRTKRLCIGLLSVLLLIMMVLPMPPVRAQDPPSSTASTMTILAADSNFVYSGAPAVSQNDSRSWLIVKEEDVPPSTKARRAFVKFDLSGIQGRVTNAVLRLKCANCSSASGVAVSVYGVGGDEWSGSTLTWNNQPAFDQPVLDRTVTTPSNEYYEWNVTDFVRGENEGDGKASFAVLGDKSINITQAFFDHRSTAKPELAVWTEPEWNTPPQVVGTETAESYTQVSLVFDQTIYPAAADVTSQVYLARDGISFEPLTGADAAAISDNRLTVHLSTALSGTENRVKVLGGTIRDADGNVLLEDLIAGPVTGQISFENFPILSQLRVGHPRLLTNAADLGRIRAQKESDSLTLEWYGKLKAYADTVLNEPVSSYVLSSGQLLPVSRTVRDRVQALSFLYLLDGDARYAERALAELNAAADFPDWNPDHFLDTAEMTNAFAYGYDWLYAYMTPSQRSGVKDALIRLGLNPALESYRSPVSGTRHGWVITNNNWNLVSNAGIGMGALAIADEAPELAEELLSSGLDSLPLALSEFAPQGAWMEGLSYWNYSIIYLIPYIAALESALGNDQGLAMTPGLSMTGLFPVYLTGPAGKAFNFGDAGTTTHMPAEMFWMAEKYNKPEYGWWGLQGEQNDEWKRMLWYKPDNGYTAAFPLDRHIQGGEIASFRSGWGDTQDLFLGFKAGANNINHGDLDVGSYVIDALGERWAEDLGADNYTLPGYFDDKENGARWEYYRKRAEGHNTLAIGPDFGQDQTVNARAEITGLVSGRQEAYAIADMTPVYKAAADSGGSVKRGVRLFDSRRKALVQDEIRLQQPEDIWWFMHTTASVQILDEGKSAILRKGSKRMWVRIVSDNASLHFTLRDAQPLMTSPDRGASGESDRGIYKKLAIHAGETEELNLAVMFVPLREDEPVPDSLPDWVPMSQWTVTEPGEAGTGLQNITLDGQPLPGFTPSKYTYDYLLPEETSPLPEIRAAAGSGEMEIIPASGIPGTAEILLRRDGKTESYRIHFGIRPPADPVVTASADDGNIPANTLDGNFSTRWSALGSGQWIQYRLDQTRELDSIRIAFYNGDQRSTLFDVLTSVDGVQWSLAYSGRSSGTTSYLETFGLQTGPARYVRIVGYGNSVNLWNSISEVRLDGVVSSPEPAPNQLYSVRLSIPGEQLSLGQTLPLHLEGTMFDGQPADLSVAETVYFSRNEQLAQVTEDGYVTGVGLGVAQISAETTLNFVTKRANLNITVAEPYTSYAMASEDAYIRGGTYSKTNYGGAKDLAMKLTAADQMGGAYDRIPVMKFPVATSGNVRSVTLLVYGAVDDDPGNALGDAPYIAGVYAADGSWSEKTVTWELYPFNAERRRAGTLTFGKIKGWATADVTAEYLAAMANGTSLNLLILPETMQAKVGMDSKEGTQKPYLKIRYEEPPAVPVPSDGSGTPQAGEPADGSGTPQTGEPTDGSGTPQTGDPSDGSGTPQTGEPADGSGTPQTGEPTDGSGTPQTGESTDGSVGGSPRDARSPDKPDAILVTPEIASRKDGAMVIPIPQGTRRISLPEALVKQWSTSVIELQFDRLSVRIPEKFFEEFRSNDAQAGITEYEILMEPVPADPGDGHDRTEGLQLKSRIYDLTLKVKYEDGTYQGLSRFVKPLDLSIAVGDERADHELLGIYTLNETTGEWEYVGGEWEKSGGAIRVKVSHFSRYAVMEQRSRFNDVGEEHWARRAVSVLHAKRIVNGRSLSEFDPNAAVTRAEFVSMLVRGLHVPDAGEDSGNKPVFTDIPGDRWYAGKVDAAVRTGIIQGTGNNRFDPEQPITRQETAVMVARALEWRQGSLPPQNIVSPIMAADLVDADDWAKDAIIRLMGAGLMNGREERKFCPLELSTRAESAQMIYNLLGFK